MTERPRHLLHRRAACGVIGLVLAASAWSGPPEVPVEATASRQGEKIVVQVVAHVPASVGDTWSVLTDFDHMASFGTAVKASQVLQREGNLLQVAQTTEHKVALMTFRQSSVRQVELLPTSEIRTRLVSGDYKSYDSTTRLQPEPQGTLLTYQGEYVPSRWVPPGIGLAMVSDQARKHYGLLIAEVLRRRVPGAAATAASRPGS